MDNELLPILATLIWFVIGVVLGVALQANTEKKENRRVYVYRIVRAIGKHDSTGGYIISHIPCQELLFYASDERAVIYTEQLSEEDAILYMRGLL